MSGGTRVERYAPNNAWEREQRPMDWSGKELGRPMKSPSVNRLTGHIPSGLIYSASPSVGKPKVGKQSKCWESPAGDRYASAEKGSPVRETLKHEEEHECKAVDSRPCSADLPESRTRAESVDEASFHSSDFRLLGEKGQADWFMRPLERRSVVQTRIRRERHGFRHRKSTYRVYLKDSEQFLMAARKRPNKPTSNYLISSHSEILDRKSPYYIGKLRSNFKGTEFNIYDDGSNPNSNSKKSHRRELACVLYKSQIMAKRGPRDITVLLPKSGELDNLTSTDPSENRLAALYGRHAYTCMHTLKNKKPRWSETHSSFVLNFGNRVTQSSVKNFQLVSPHNDNRIILQFGRTGDDTFTMDFRYPLSPLQAFGICLSAFDPKLACD